MKKVTQVITPFENNGKEVKSDLLRVAAYARVSTESDEQMNSLANQRKYYEEKIKNH